MENIQVPVPAAVTKGFAEIAHSARLNWHMVYHCGDPSQTSRFAQVNDLYKFEKVSDRARHYVMAGLEHLVMWADFAAPLKFHPEQATNFTVRPTHALARAALESAAQAVWLMDTNSPRECIQRHLRLIRWDLQEYRKSHLDQEGKKRVIQQDDKLVARVASDFTKDEIRPPQGYLWVIQQACRPKDLDLDENNAERLWRAASGAAHGMYWTNVELNDVAVGEEYEPGHFRAVRVPNPQALLTVLKASDTMVSYATAQFITFAGADYSQLFVNARKWLAQQITLKPGADPEILRHLSRDSL